MGQRLPWLAPPRTRTGWVKSFLPHEGYGFIYPDGGGPDIFVHRRILGDGRDRTAFLVAGTKVSYEVGWDSAGGRGRFTVASCDGWSRPAADHGCPPSPSLAPALATAVDAVPDPAVAPRARTDGGLSHFNLRAPSRQAPRGEGREDEDGQIRRATAEPIGPPGGHHLSRVPRVPGEGSTTRRNLRLPV